MWGHGSTGFAWHRWTEPTVARNVVKPRFHAKRTGQGSDPPRESWHVWCEAVLDGSDRSMLTGEIPFVCMESYGRMKDPEASDPGSHIPTAWTGESPGWQVLGWHVGQE